MKVASAVALSALRDATPGLSDDVKLEKAWRQVAKTKVLSKKEEILGYIKNEIEAQLVNSPLVTKYTRSLIQQALKDHPNVLRDAIDILIEPVIEQVSLKEVLK